MEIKPFSFVVPASRIPESAERTCALFIHNLAKPAAAATPESVHTYLGGQSGRVFRNTNPIYFVDLKLSSQKPGLHPDFLALHQ